MPSTSQFGTSRSHSRFIVRRARAITATVTTFALTAAGVAAALSHDSSQATASSAGGYEVPTIADTNYAIPAGATFVANNGSDSNAGTQTSPYATVAKAVAVAAPGATIVLRGGTYRETLNSVFKRITLQAYPHETVWMKGSVIANQFSASGGAWVQNNWNPSGVCDNCYSSTMVDPNYPAAGYTDQVFIDGVTQRQVLAKASMGAGDFFVDNANNQLWLGTNPSGHTIESTVYDKAMQFNTAGASGSIVRGIGFAHYAGHYNMDVPGAVIANTPNVTFDHDTFAWNAGRGLSILYPGSAVADSLFIYNGINGVHANNADGLVFVNNRVAFNNIEHWNHSPGSAATIAGFKITSSSDTIMKNNLFEGNDSNGLWFDLSNYNAIVTNNTAINNSGHGLYYEVSGNGIIAGNLSANNASDGIKVSGSANVAVWNNTVVNNGAAGIGVYDDARTNTSASDIALDITWDTHNVTVANNIVVGDSRATKSLLTSMDASSPRHLASTQMLAMNDHNLWARPTATAPSSAMQWQASVSQFKSYADLAAMQSATGRELASTSADNVPLSRLFVDAANDDYRLAVGSPGFTTGAALPGNIATLLGISGTAHLGAYSWPTNGGSTPPPPTTTTQPAATTTTQPAATTTTQPAATTTTQPAATTTTQPAATTTTQPPATTTTIPSTSGAGMTTPVFALKNATTGDRIYTTSASERDALVAAHYTMTSVAFKAATAPSTTTMAVYRLRNPKNGEHLYTTSTNERDTLVAKAWKLEGIAFYGARRSGSGLISVYRLYDGITSDHYLSTSSVVATGSRLESVPFYAAP